MLARVIRWWCVFCLLCVTCIVLSLWYQIYSVFWAYCEAVYAMEVAVPYLFTFDHSDECVDTVGYNLSLVLLPRRVHCFAHRHRGLLLCANVTMECPLRSLTRKEHSYSLFWCSWKPARAAASFLEGYLVMSGWTTDGLPGMLWTALLLFRHGYRAHIRGLFVIVSGVNF